MPSPGIDSLAELVAVAEQLVAAADGEQRGAVLDGGGDRVALGAQHVLGDEHLVAVLAAADVDQVVLGRVEAVARAGGRVAEGDAPPLAAALQEEDVAAVRVDVHLLRVEREQPELAGVRSCRHLQQDDGGVGLVLARS